MRTSQLQSADDAIVCLHLGAVKMLASQACSRHIVLPPDLIESLSLPK